AAVAGATDEDALAVALMRKRAELAKEAKGEAARGEREQEKDRVDDEDRRPQTAAAAAEAGADDGGDGAEGHAPRVAHDVGEAGVAPQSAIDAAEQQRGEFQGEHDRQRAEEEAPLAGVGRRAQHDGVREVVRENDQHDVERDLEEAALVREVQEEREDGGTARRDL